MVRPTFMGIVPRICEMLYQQYQTELQRRMSGMPDANSHPVKQALLLEFRRTVLGWPPIS